MISGFPIPKIAEMKSPVVFVIDRNPIHNSLIKYHLNVNKFFSIQTFRSGEECLYRINKGPIPDFLISDYDVGDITGFDLLKKVQVISSTIHVIFFSSYDDPILAVRLLDSGAADYIVKTGKLEMGIAELVKNVKFLAKEWVLFK